MSLTPFEQLERRVIGKLALGDASRPSETRRRVEALLDGRERRSGEVLTPTEVSEHWSEEWGDRLRNDRDVVGIVHGPAGTGKSTLVMDLIRQLDEYYMRAFGEPRRFTPRTLVDRVAFRGWQVPTLYRSVPQYSGCWIDEAATADLMATGTFDPDQRDLVELINIIRAKNVALFILLPDITDLAKAFRARRADYRIEIPDYPTEGINKAFVGQKARGRKFFMDDGRWLGFIDDETFNPIEWREYRNSVDPVARALWNSYRPLKMENLDKTVDEIEADMLMRKARREAKRDLEKMTNGR